ncbi:acyl-CoA dehydrogenase family protein [Paracoccus laeviglucosivorans]|uniref:Acyl-CoA dehydrogenase n=1 Tax=Paracoccus laeviglucosivorans TaxID=1197861 RepID=A0A521FPW3_9RHOB|nr:acyl-CoA dehydrogenase family protein [Paracoccus laeviglucosivorans]SMO98265.1 Acyl-CoA dehydrogenase [Paracoccus laeviglucosivorans]
MRDSIADTLALLRDAPEDGPDGPTGQTLVAALREGGLLAACGELAHQPADALDLMAALVAIGSASLSAGRLFEGHVNAVKLVKLYAGRAAPCLMKNVASGALFGIWGADGAVPARLEAGVLRGEKLFASGADVVDRAVISVQVEDAPQLLLFTRDQLAGRLHPEEWAVSGMSATASGRCVLEGLKAGDAVPLGQPGDYLAEPHFQGGVWRYAAVQLGAMESLTRIAAHQLQSRDQAAAPLQSLRLRRMLTACETARLWLVQAASAVERLDAPAAAADRAILARLVVADEAKALLAAMDDALGAASFQRAHPAERIRRDLSLYLRQANPDRLSAEVTARVLASGDWS